MTRPQQSSRFALVAAGCAAIVGLILGCGGSGPPGLLVGGAGGNGASNGGSAAGGGTIGGWGLDATPGVPGGFNCPVTPSACSDGIDNDGDGLIDAQDPECVGPCDNDEGSFATGIPGDNIDACKQDCFFDGNSGQGDDGCDWNLKCDPKNPGANAAKPCPYDPTYKNCPAQQSDQCIKFCQRLTPNGCDCFGCCAVPWNGAIVKIMLAPTCTAEFFGDPTKCPPCTQSTDCLNTCGPCEICVGKPTVDPSCNLPPPGTIIPPADSGVPAGDAATPPGSDAGAPPPQDNPCPVGVEYCGNGGACPGGMYCLTGCCVSFIQ
jgi:hypothetical protein